MELCVRRSKNISELKGWGVLRYWRSRWIQNGSPIATAPAKNQGARKPTLHPPLSNQEIFAQRVVERPGCGQQLIIDAGGVGFRLEGGDVGIDLNAVLFLG